MVYGQQLPGEDGPRKNRSTCHSCAIRGVLEIGILFIIQDLMHAYIGGIAKLEERP